MEEAGPALLSPRDLAAAGYSAVDADAVDTLPCPEHPQQHLQQQEPSSPCKYYRVAGEVGDQRHAFVVVLARVAVQSDKSQVLVQAGIGMHSHLRSGPATASESTCGSDNRVDIVVVHAAAVSHTHTRHYSDTRGRNRIRGSAGRSHSPLHSDPQIRSRSRTGPDKDDLDGSRIQQHSHSSSDPNPQRRRLNHARPPSFH